VSADATGVGAGEHQGCVHASLHAPPKRDPTARCTTTSSTPWESTPRQQEAPHHRGRVPESSSSFSTLLSRKASWMLRARQVAEETLLEELEQVQESFQVQIGILAPLFQERACVVCSISGWCFKHF